MGRSLLVSGLLLAGFILSGFAADGGLYQAVALPANIGVTPATESNGNVRVVGSPRKTEGHPCTLWDQEDIDRLKTQLKKNKDLQNAFQTLQAEMDARIQQPLGVPAPDANDPSRKGWGVHEKNAKAISNLGVMYALTGDEKYGEYARRMLIAYAQGLPRYSRPADWTEKNMRSQQDRRLTGQFLEDGNWLCKVAFGYDLVYNLSSWTAAERNLLKTDLFQELTKNFYHPSLRYDYISSPHNRSALCTSGTLMAGYACEDEEMVNLALYGVGGSPNNIKGGVFGMHFSPACIMPDGMWLEGAPAYQIGIASCALFNDAETLWHHGIDMYSYRDGILKRFLDSSLAFAYPDDRLIIPSLRDTASRDGGLLGREGGKSNPEVTIPYELGYCRYQDPAYLSVCLPGAADRDLSMTIHAGPPSPFADLPGDATSIPPAPVENANFYAVGYGITKLANPDGNVQLIMEFGGEAGAHDHPSKLSIDAFALGDSIMPMCGVIFPYGDPLDAKWFHTTMANCVLAVDEKSQTYIHNRSGSAPPIDTVQLVYGPAATMGIQKAWSDTLYDFKLIQDRALFVTPQYIADIYSAFGSSAHKYDMAWHFRGEMKGSSLKPEPMTFPEPVALGYNALLDVTHAQAGENAWTANFITRTGKPVVLFAAAGPSTEVIFGKGHINTKTMKENPPTVLERRDGLQNTVYGNVVDITGKATPYVKGVTQQGGLDEGYSLLQVETQSGTDLCFTSYRPDSFAVGDLKTDAQQAFVLREGAGVRALYLGGGTSLTLAGSGITRSEPGLAYIEKLTDSSYVAGNPSPSAATVTITLPALDTLSAYSMDAQGRRGGPVNVVRDAKTRAVTLKLDAGAKVGFSAP